RAAGEAHPAAAADREEAGAHVIARLERADLRPDLDHDAAPFVATHDREEPRPRPVGGPARPDVARPEVLVRVAEPGGDPPDQDLVAAGRIEIDLLDLPVLSPAPKHRCVGLHGVPPSSRRSPDALQPTVTRRTGPRSR